MKKVFSAYYPPTQEELQLLWKSAVFALDSNVLLNLYRYSQATSNELIGLLRFVGGRLWIPHQVGLEYHRNRLSVIEHQMVACDELATLIDKNIKEIEQEFAVRFKEMRFSSKTLRLIRNQFETVKKNLAFRKKKCESLLRNDTVLQSLTDLFSGKVGDPYPDDKLEAIYADADKRFKSGRPPGFEDADKKNNRKYGDVVLWKQLIDKATNGELPIIFVTDDRKSDWWMLCQAAPVLPHPELVQEMSTVCHMSFFMYDPLGFMESAGRYIGWQVKKEAVQELKMPIPRPSLLGSISTQPTLASFSQPPNALQFLVPPVPDSQVSMPSWLAGAMTPEGRQAAGDRLPDGSSSGTFEDTDLDNAKG